MNLRQGSAKDDLIFVIGFMVLLYTLWIGIGGPQGGSLLGDLGKINQSPTQLTDGNNQTHIAGSRYRGKFHLGWGTATSTDPNREFITITADHTNKQTPDISIWRLRNDRGMTVQIGGAAILNLNNTGYAGPVPLAAGETAIVTTGRSPVSTSFKTNKCSGYLNVYKFTPPFSLQCPLLKNVPHPRSAIAGFDEQCLNYINSIGSCVSQPALPAPLTTVCKNFIASNTTYQACASRFSNDADFYKPEWRLYLRQEEEFWSGAGEHIQLLDERGNLISLL